MAATAPDPGEERPSSVFRAPDQAEMIARIDSVDEDDLGSDFFATSVGEAGDAAVRMFDLGIRTLTDEVPPAMSTPFDEAPRQGASVPEGQRHPLSADLADPAVRAAFILGGPAALG